MTGVSIAVTISERLSKLLAIQNTIPIKDISNNNLKSILNHTLKYTIEDLKRDCNLHDLTIDLDKMVLKCATDTKEFVFKVQIDNDDVRLFYPTKLKEHYTS